MPQQTQQAGSNQVKATDGTPLNPLAVNLAKAIRQQESQGNYNAVGDNGDSHGAYQFNKDNFKNWATEYGLDPNDFSPTNQDKVAYTRINSQLQEGNAPSEIAARWNGAKVENGKYVPLNPDYVEKVKQNYAQIVGGNAPQTQNLASGGVNQAQASNGTQAPESTLQKGLDVAGAVGNFLFPIAGDIGAMIQGKPTGKTGLQIAGDAGLSALPFIPGLGEVGLAAKGVEAGLEGAGLATKAGGLLSKILPKSTVAKGALTGYGAGVAGNLSQGQDLGQSFAPNINTIGGAALGGLAPVLLKGATKLVGGASKITPQIENALKDNNIPVKDYNEYIQAAKIRSGDVRTVGAMGKAGDVFGEAANIAESKTKEAGALVGEAKQAEAKLPLSDITPAIAQFAQRIKQDYGIVLTIKNGKVLPTFIQGRARQVIPAIQKRIVDIYKQLNSLKKGGTIQKALDVRDNLNELIDQKARDNFGKSLDPLEGLISNMRYAVKNVIAKTSPKIAEANSAYEELKNLEGQIAKMGGKDLQRGELLMKRVFSGDKSRETLDLFQKIKDATGIDLVNHAVLAKHAIDVAGDESQKSLLQQAIESGIAAHTGGIPALIGNAAQGIAQRTFANPEKIGRSLVQGKQGLLKRVLKQGGAKAAIEGSRLLPQVLGFPQ